MGEFEIEQRKPARSRRLHGLEETVAYTSPVLVRSWRQLDYDEFRAAVTVSRLCRPEDWPVGIEELAVLYNDEIQRGLDQLIPLHTVRVDQVIHGLTLSVAPQTRRLEPASAAADRRCQRSTSSGTDVAAAAAAKLRSQKCQEFWRWLSDTMHPVEPTTTMADGGSAYGSMQTSTELYMRSSRR